MDERKALLQQKIKINKQKSQRNKLIDFLPQDISTVLEKCDLITSPKLDRILDEIHQKWNYELHKEEFVKKYGDFRKEFSWEQEVIQYMQEIEIEKKVVCLFLGIDDSPIYLVEGKWVIENFNILWQSIDNDDLWIISKDFNYGVLVSRYGGYLEQDPNPKEIFYSITKWNT
ncbi:hypothetical protein ABET41_09715 [Metabacillus fastidiosus]|uniref:Uncharacterized protein n=1 Tax=Metabacillus fastidiosus TaxID=1458 RepID=A0ABU6P0F9_9BACI|nr:hypothetical protein [Metabacillus fastidiosus]MED4402580.1 hypothetical protein [Metabacillus fastidiosus]MED4461940.1 hypothetical protein [Metabacillus fastidiosus]